MAPWRRVIWSDGVAYRKRDEGWARWDPAKDTWTLTVKGKEPPPRTPRRRATGSSPTVILLIGVGSILVAVLITVTYAKSDVSAVLAAVTGVIGSFTGHAAGHAAARSDRSSK